MSLFYNIKNILYHKIFFSNFEYFFENNNNKIDLNLF
jgi:hypothetical protein